MPALTRCNTKKGTGAGLRRHEKTRPGSPNPNHKIKWPSPWSLQTPVCKSHLHSARVDPPCLKGVHFSPEVRSASGCSPRKARTEACLLPPLRRPLCERAPCWPFWPEAQGLCHVMACCNRVLVSGSLCSFWSGAGTPQAAGHWLCSNPWRGVGDTLTTATARPQSLVLSLSGSPFLSFFLLFFFTNTRQAMLVGTSACSALGVATTFCRQIWLSESTTLSPLRPVRPSESTTLSALRTSRCLVFTTPFRHILAHLTA